MRERFDCSEIIPINVLFKLGERIAIVFGHDFVNQDSSSIEFLFERFSSNLSVDFNGYRQCCSGERERR